MPREDAKSNEGQSFRRRGIRFDAERRELFLRHLRRGQSRTIACKLAGVDRSTVWTWVVSGRSANPKHPEHVKFARDFDAAEAQGIAAAFTNVRKLAKEDPRAAIAMVHALDERFGGPAKRRRLEAEADLAELKVKAARAALKGGGSALVLGVEALLEAPLSDAARAEIRAYLAQAGVRALVERDLGIEAKTA